MRSFFGAGAIAALIGFVGTSEWVTAQEAPEQNATQISTKRSVDPDVVGAGGEFTHRIPISIPEFRNLPLPISLSYNSSDISRSGVDKIVAFGWSLGGFSVIERKSLGGGVPTYDDGQDIYVLDGKELMACAGGTATNPWPTHYPLRYVADQPSASCSAGGNLTARVEDFNRILFDATTNTFTLTRPDGVRLTYSSIGQLAGDASVPGTSAHNYATKARWVLTQIEDTQATGNVVTYAYAFAPQADGYAHRPISVSYAGYTVELAYRNFPANAIARFATGTGIIGRQAYQLVSVRIYDGTEPIRAYQLTHAASATTATQLLTSVEEYGADFQTTGPDITGQALPAVELTYSPDTVSFFLATSQNTPSLTGKEFHQNNTVVDLNRDGADEILLRSASLSYLKMSYCDNCSPYGTYYTYAAGHFGFDKDRAALSFPLPGVMNCAVLSGPRMGNDVCITEYFTNHGSGSNEYQNQHIKTYSLSVPVAQELGYIQRNWASGFGYLISNFDLDAYPELRFKDQISQLDDGDITQAVSAQSIPLYDPLLGGSPVFVHDFTGDRVDDILKDSFRRSLPEAGIYGGVMRGVGFSVSESIPASLLGILSNYSFLSTNQNAAYDHLGYADMNGDGLDDIVYHSHAGAAIDKLIYFPSTGWGFGQSVETDLPANYLTQTRGYLGGLNPKRRRDGHRSSIMDVNADGIVDLILHDGYQDRSITYSKLAPYLSGPSWILLGTGTGFVPVAVEGSTNGFTGLVASGDFDGDGLIDIALEGAPNAASGATYLSKPGRVLFGNGGIPNRLVSVKSETGGLTTIDYAPSSEFGTNQMPGVQQVVKTITTDDGRGGVSSVEYRYVTGHYDFIARQTLGYKTVTAYLPPLPGEDEGPQVVTTYLNDHVAEYGLIKSRIVTQNDVTLSREIFDYSIQKTGKGPWRADRISERQATRSGTTLVETRLTRAYNSFGQVIRETNLGFTHEGANLDASDDVTTTVGYVENLVDYIVDRPSFRREEAGAEPTAALTNDLSYAAMSYDAAPSNAVAATAGNLTKLEEWTGDTAALTLRTARLLTYDAWGNVLTETDAKGHTTLYSYDAAKHLFRLSASNPLGQVETVAWNTRCQKPAAVTNPNGGITTTTYDGFCREILVDLPGPQSLATNYVQFGTVGAQYVEQVQNSGSSTPGSTTTSSRTYFDGFGRTWATTRSGTTSSIDDAVLTLSGYDARGNLAWTSLPLPWSALGLTPNPAERTTMTYDGLDRPRDTLLPDGATRSTLYHTVSLGHYGGPVLDYPATTRQDEHCFDALGADTLCGEATQIFDAAGRLIRADRTDLNLTDVDAGGQSLRSTSYRYDAKGNLIAVTDPGGISFAYSYDVFGNRLTADDPGLGFWTLSYDENNNLLTQTDAKGQLISFAYDPLNRVTLKTVGSGDARIETRFTYDEPRPNRFNIGRETTQEVWSPLHGTIHRVERDWLETGLLGVERHTIDGRTYPLESEYTPAGTLARHRLPVTPGATTTEWTGSYHYDAAGRMTGFGDYIPSVTYNAWSQPTAVTYANGVTEAYAYNPSRGWLTGVMATLPGGDMAFRAAYDRSATGRIYRADTQALVGGNPTDMGGSYDYAYDYTGRLLSATNWRGAAGVDQVFAYDRAGRIRLKGPTPATATAYDYSDPLTPDHAPGSVTTGGVTTPFSYDANGNMLTGLGGKIMSYDGENRPLSVTYLGTKTCYTYGADGQRLKKVEGLPPAQDCTALPANAAITVYFGPVEVRNWQVAGQEQVLTYPHPSVKLLNGTTPAQATYLHRDGLGSVRAITDAGGVKVESALYKPFGEQSEWLLPGTPAPETKGWIGERFDADAGLQYLNARYYDPDLGLFLQPDWFEVTKAGVGTNRFSYSFNDPVNKLDPGGNQFHDWGKDQEEADEDNKRRADELRETAKRLRDPQTLDEKIAAFLGGAGRAERMAAEFELRIGMSRGDRIRLDLGDLVGTALLGLAPARSVVAKKPSGSTALVPPYPPNNGFLGNPVPKSLEPGARIDRYGGTEFSRFFSPAGTPAEMRALPPGTSDKLRTFEVKKTIEVEAGQAAPYYGQPGLGTQYRTSSTLGELLEGGYLVEIFP